MKSPVYILFTLLVLSGIIPADAGQLPEKTIQRIDSMVVQELRNRAFPSASFLIGNKNGVLYRKNYGFQDYASGVKVTDEDVYDIASCTKVMSTTFVIMKLYDEGKIELAWKIGTLVPQIAGTCLASLTVQELLTHTSGIPPQMFHPDVIEQQSLFLTDTPHEGYRKLGEHLYIDPAVDTLIINRMCEGYNAARRGKYRYNCSNFWLLKLAVENITGKTLDVLTNELFAELGCSDTGYNPLNWKDPRHIIPTEEDTLLRKCVLRGYVHDEFAAMEGGVGGNSGLFSNASDMALFCEMILNNGMLRGKRIIAEKTVRLFTSSPCKAKGVYRGLGFDKRSPSDDAMGGDNKFGHTGFTGTMFWIDRNKGIYMIFLSNSVHPTRKNNRLNRSQLRLKIWTELSD